MNKHWPSGAYTKILIYMRRISKTVYIEYYPINMCYIGYFIPVMLAEHAPGTKC